MEEKTESLVKRLTLEVSLEIHQAIKARAAFRNIPIRLWVLRAIDEAIKKENQYE